jgi:ABC-2 type transport system permease protein
MSDASAAVGRTGTAVRAGTRSFFRKPFNVVLLLVLPAVSIQLYGVSLSQFPPVGIFDAAGSLETTGRITGAVFATGALAGVLGLFQMLSARSADRRLTICGFSGLELLAARVVTVAAVGAVISAVATVTLLWLAGEPPATAPPVFVGLGLATLVYGLLGVLVGTLLPRELEGSLVLVILADVDNVFASGLFAIDDSITQFAPLTHPHDIVTAAVVDGRLATEHLLPSLGHVLVFGLLALVGYTYTVGGDA